MQIQSIWTAPVPCLYGRSVSQRFKTNAGIVSEAELRLSLPVRICNFIDKCLYLVLQQMLDSIL